jgi:hypothetical protein
MTDTTDRLWMRWSRVPVLLFGSIAVALRRSVAIDRSGAEGTVAARYAGWGWSAERALNDDLTGKAARRSASEMRPVDGCLSVLFFDARDELPMVVGPEAHPYHELPPLSAS